MNPVSLPETTMLLWSVVLGLVQLVLAAAATTQHVGLAYNLSSRDTPSDAAIGKLAGRLNRVFHNFRETFPLFAAAVLLVAVLNRHDQVSAIGSELYFWARLAYVPVYALGIPGLRSAIWAISIAGLIMVLLAGFAIA